MRKVCNNEAIILNHNPGIIMQSLKTILAQPSQQQQPQVERPKEFERLLPELRQLVFDYCLTDSPTISADATSGTDATSTTTTTTATTATAPTTISIADTQNNLYKIFGYFYKDDLDAALTTPQKLLESVLLDSSDDKIIKIAKKDPRLLFIKATAFDHALDLAGNRRTIEEWSPFQAIFGTMNYSLLEKILNDLENYFSEKPEARLLAMQQIDEKFPNTSTDPKHDNRFDLKPCTDEFKQMIDKLTLAISKDKELRKTGNPSQATLDLLDAYRIFSKPETVTSGYHYNMSNMIYIRYVFENSSKRWGGMERNFFSTKVIGSEQRLLTKAQWKVILRRFSLQQNKLADHFKTMSGNGGRLVEVMVLPLRQGQHGKILGENVFFDDYFGHMAQSWLSILDDAAIASSVIEQPWHANAAKLSKFMQQVKQQPSGPSCLIM